MSECERHHEETELECHWSLLPQFKGPRYAVTYRQLLLEHLSASAAGGYAYTEDETSRYAVFATYLRPDPHTCSPICGRAEVRREQADGETRYAVRYDNQVTGEESYLTFSTATDRFRSLRGPWSIRTLSRDPGSFKGISVRGWIERVDDHQVVCLDVGTNVTIRPARVPNDQPVTAEWALPDLLAAGELSNDDRIAILDNLEKAAAGNRPVELGIWKLPASAGGARLRGVCVQGPHRNPASYWLDANGRVVVWSNTSLTLVRST